MAAVSVRAAQQMLTENSATWVQELQLRVEFVATDRAVLRLPFSDNLVRIGGMICGQALMSAADTAMVIALAGAFGGFKPVTTVSQNVTFMRPISGTDTLVEARIVRLGRTLAFGEILLRADGDEQPAAHATATYAILAG